MALSGYRREWSRQPFGQLRLNQGDPLTDGLVAGIVGNSRADLVTGQVYSGSQTGETATELGVGATLNGTSNGLWREFPAGTFSTRLTAFALVTPRAANQNDKRIFALGLSTAGSGFFAGIGTANAGNINRLRYAAAAGGDLTTTGAYIGAGQPIAVMVRAGPDDTGVGFIRVSVNGVQDATTQAGTLVGATTFDRIAWGQLRRTGDATHFAGAISLGLAWNRVLSDAEAEELFQNPWRAVRGRRIWVPVSAGGGGGDINLTGASCTQAATSSTGAITQAHALTGSNASQAATSSAGAITQVHQLAGANSAQAAVSGTGIVSLLGSVDLVGSNSAQAATSSGGAISQIHQLVGANSTQATSSSTGAISLGVAINLAGAACAQASTSSAAAITQAHQLAAAACAQASTSSAGAITRVQQLVAAACAQASISGTGAISLGVITAPVAPGARIWVPPDESRVLTGSSERRVWAAPAESRTLKATP